MHTEYEAGWGQQLVSSKTTGPIPIPTGLLCCRHYGGNQLRASYIRETCLLSTCRQRPKALLRGSVRFALASSTYRAIATYGRGTLSYGPGSRRSAARGSSLVTTRQDSTQRNRLLRYRVICAYGGYSGIKVRYET